MDLGQQRDVSLSKAIVILVKVDKRSVDYFYALEATKPTSGMLDIAAAFISEVLVVRCGVLFQFPQHDIVMANPFCLRATPLGTPVQFFQTHVRDSSRFYLYPFLHLLTYLRFHSAGLTKHQT